jgi:Domain of unknown function (DUF6438)
VNACRVTVSTTVTMTMSMTAYLLAACASPRTQAVDQHAREVADTVSVVALSRGACYGTCPIYTVQVKGNGRVQFKGTRFVRHVGSDSASIPATPALALQAAFVARHFDAVPSVIEQGSSACGSAYVTDMPSNELTLTSASSTHRVRWDEGCRAHPAMLDTLARMVDSVSGTSRWIPQTRP